MKRSIDWMRSCTAAGWSAPRSSRSGSLSPARATAVLAELRVELRATGEALLAQKIREIGEQEKQQASLRELAADADRAAAALRDVQTGKLDATPAAKLADEIRGIVDPASKAQASESARKLRERSRQSGGSLVARVVAVNIA